MSLQHTSAGAQEWSQAEREAWTAVTQGWEALRAGSVDGFMATFHPRFLGWNMNRPAPLDVEAERSGTVAFLDSYSWVSYRVEPVAIRITDDVAIVHYRYHEVVRSTADGTVHEEHGRATQVLKRLDGEWKTLSILSGPSP